MRNIFKNIFNRNRAEPLSDNRYYNTSYGLFSSYTGNRSMNLSTVYRCVNVISEAVAQLSLEPYELEPDGNKRKYQVNTPEYLMLNRKPCNHLTRFELLKLLVSSMLLDGNGYALIERDNKGNAIQIHYIQPEKVVVSELSGNINYMVEGKTVESCNIIHLKNYSRDGIIGISTVKMAADTLGISYDSENHARNFFKSGGAVSGILSVIGIKTSPKQIQDIKEEFANNFGAMGGASGGIAIIPDGQSFTPVRISPADAQLLESRKFNVIEICRFFGVSPVKAFDLSNSSYATVEATQLSFLTDTIQPLLSLIELEFVTKIFMPSFQGKVDIKFATDELLRADKAAMGSYYTSLFNIGVLSQNDIRKSLDLPVIAGGNTYFIQGNLSTPDKIKQQINNN